uniref:F-box domain-containing protein n=1 Tax=Rhipicephalus pulchellus TaxID=72859 RepID=L7LWB0_RHIPC
MVEHEAAVEEVEHDFLADDGPPLKNLPGHVLIKICQYMEPFDVLSFGRTCRDLHKLTLSRYLWTSLALSWCRGVWHHLPHEAEDGPEDPKQWLFHLLRLCRDRRPPKMERVSFENGEIWLRSRNDKFACKVSMLAWAYKAMNNRKSPFVLQCIWVDDIALFKRSCPKIRFNVSELTFDSDSASQLAALGEARSHDLRGRKQPHIDARNYILYKPPSSATWCEDLFPQGPEGSICPLLVCPSTDGYALESSGVDGLIMCVVYVLERHLARACLRKLDALGKIAATIKKLCWCLCSAYGQHKRMVEEKWPNCPVAHAIVSMSEEGWPDLSSWQPYLEPLGLQWRGVMSQCAALLKEHGTLDAIVDMARIRWRRSLLSDIGAVLGHSDETFVSRINLTDCDLIGGDNPHQDMAAAAFVSPSGALVTWQLLGQGYC